MRILFALLLVVSLVYGTCQGNTAPVERNAIFCTRYTEFCCTESSETEMKTNFESKIIPIFGNDGCASNIKDLLCAWNCDPNNVEFVTMKAIEDIYYKSVLVSTTWAASFLESCNDRCYSVPGLDGFTVGDLYKEPAAYVVSFNSNNDPSYVPSGSEYPVISYNVTSLAGAWSVECAAASGNDLVGCESNEQDIAASISVSLMTVFVAIFAAL